MGGSGEGATRWEVRAHGAYLLRPIDISHLQEPRPERAKAASRGASKPAKLNSKRSKAVARHTEGAGEGEAAAEGAVGLEGLGGDDRGLDEAPARSIPSKFKALPPREAAIEATRVLTASQRRDVASAAAADGDLARIDALLALGFDFSVPLDDYGQTAVFLAAANGHTRILKRLLPLGLSPDCPSHGGTTAACAAAARGQSEALALLCEWGADVTAVGPAGLSPLGWVLRAVCPLLMASEPCGVGAEAARKALSKLAAASGGAVVASTCYTRASVAASRE